jgi:hypothetical protein
MWGERVAAIGDPELPTHHAGWALMARYSQHVSSLLQEVTATDAHLRLRLEEYAGQVKAQNHAVKDIQKGKQELLQKNACLETRIKELNDELMRTNHSRDFKANDLDDTRTRLQQAQDELTAAQSYVHHLKTELHEKDEQLEASQAQAADLHDRDEQLVGLGEAASPANGLVGRQGQRKAGSKYYDPFQVVERDNDVTYKLKLLSGVYLHDVFHVELLKKFCGDPLAAPGAGVVVARSCWFTGVVSLQQRPAGSIKKNSSSCIHHFSSRMSCVLGERCDVWIGL